MITRARLPDVARPGDSPADPAAQGVASDPYESLLTRTRDLDAARRQQRDEWYERLPTHNKEELLFELEVLLKATACFANPRNHPGPARRAPVVAQDFREAATLLRDGLTRATQLIRMLLGSRDRAYVFHRYLETAFPDDGGRSRLGSGGGSADGGPEDALVGLRHSLTQTVTVLDGLLRAPRVPFRTFYAAAALAEREVSRNPFFNPLRALEFRPELDRVTSSELILAMRRAPRGRAAELTALSVLSLSRLLHYLRLLGRISAEQREFTAARTYLVASVLFADARALSRYLLGHAGPGLSGAYARKLFALPRTELPSARANLAREAHLLAELRTTLQSVAEGLRLEMRRAFAHGFPPLDTLPTDQGLREAIEGTASSLRPALRHWILLLLRTLGAAQDAASVFEDPAAGRESLERLRRDAWMFGQILRGFLAKARSTGISDSWGQPAAPQYSRQFLAYFTAMGFPLLSVSTYPRRETLLSTMALLENGDSVDPGALARTLEECGAFQAHLEKLLDALSAGDVLRDIPFDRRSAADALRAYLRNTTT